MIRIIIVITIGFGNSQLVNGFVGTFCAQIGVLRRLAVGGTVIRIAENTFFTGTAVVGAGYIISAFLLNDRSDIIRPSKMEIYGIIFKAQYTK